MPDVLDKIANALCECERSWSFEVEIKKKGSDEIRKVLIVQVCMIKKGDTREASLSYDGDEIISYSENSDRIIMTITTWPKDNEALATLISEILKRLKQRG